MLLTLQKTRWPLECYGGAVGERGLTVYLQFFCVFMVQQNTSSLRAQAHMPGFGLEPAPLTNPLCELFILWKPGFPNL